MTALGLDAEEEGGYNNMDIFGEWLHLTYLFF